MDAMDVDAAVADLSALTDELLLAVLCFLPVRALCRLKRTCRRMSLPAAPHADGTALSLPERAAQLIVARARAAGRARAYEPGRYETWTRVLWMLECGLLAHGVLHDVPLGAVCGGRRQWGWKKAFQQGYAERTSDEDLDKVPKDARYVMVGAYHVSGGRSTDKHVQGIILNKMPSRSALVRGSSRKSASDKTIVHHTLAFGTRDVVLRTTHDKDAFGGGATTSDNHEDGVYWYRWDEHAFGFSSDPRLVLDPADNGILRGAGGEPKPEDRLSWRLNGRGGWRAGKAYNLGDDSAEWFKVVYYRT